MHLTGNTTVTAFFASNAPPQYTLTVISADPTKGTVSGGGTYDEGTTATLTATANSGYHFTQWQDGNTQNPRTVTVTSNTTYTAYFEATQYTLTVTSANPTMGTVTGGGTYNEGATATLTATANSGYHFTQWQDGNTQNPRTVTVTGNATYTASFEANPPTQYTITVTSANPTMGTVTGGGTYNEGSTVTLTATANSGYHFTQWQDGNTSNPRTVTVTGNATYTASFEANPPTQYTITVTSANPTMGTVTGGGTYNEGATATLTATANSGYHFTQWQDGNTSNPRTVTVTGNATYTASFEANPPTQYTITVTSANPTMGTVTGGGTYNEGATVTLTATANAGYHFTQWQDGNPQNPRTVTVTGNATYTASFEADTPTPIEDPCLIIAFPYTENFDDTNTYSCLSLYDANADGETWGIIDSFGTTYSRAAYIMYAEQANDYLILPGIITPSNYSLSWKARAYDANYPETYQVYAGDSLIFSETLSATTLTSRSATFTVSAGDTVNVAFRYISDDQYAFFLDDITIAEAVPTPTQYNITVTSANPTMGSVTGGGTYNEGATVTLTATANAGYHFSQWQDGNAQNPRTITVTSNATYTASFEANAPTPIEDPCLITSFPYTENFDDTSTYSCLTLYDANGDGESWGIIDSFGTAYSRAAYIMYAVQANDYLILPGIITPGNYNLTWKARAYSANYPETYQVYAGDSLIFSETLSAITLTSRSATFTVSAGDTVNIAFRYVSDDKYAFFLDDITMSVAVPTPTQYTITVTSANPTMGTVTGGGTYNEGATATLTATANSGYHFTQWQDGNTSNPRTVTVTGNATYTASFAATQYTLTVTSANPTMGTVTGGGTYNEGATATLTATANSGYHFTQWQDGNTDNPRSITVTGNATYTASFAVTQYILTVTSANPTMGSATGGGTYNEGATATLTATANSGYHFTQWQDGNTENPRTVIVTGNSTYTASFAVTQYILTVTSANPTMGSATGGGTYNEGATVTLTATANSGYHFTQWQDGNTENPRTVTVTGNSTYTASFAVTQYTLTVTSANPTMGSVTGGGTYNEGATATLTATANSGYHFTQWQDGNTENPRTVTVTDNATYTASFAVTQYTLTVTSANPTMGVVAGGGAYNEGAAATLVATANNGYHFVRWQDNNIDNPRIVTVTTDATYIAYFEADVGIDGVATNDIRIYSCDGEIVLEGIEGMAVNVYDMMGRRVFSMASAPEPRKVAVLQRGVYLVKVGNMPARKVVVVR